MTTDPYPQYSSPELGPPFEHAYEVDVSALLESDVELPYVSSAILVFGCPVPITFTLASGDTVSLEFGNGQRPLQIRAAKIHRLPTYDQETAEPGTGYFCIPLPRIVVLW